MKRWVWLAALGGVVVFVLDRYTKLYFYNRPKVVVTVLPNWLWLHLHLNADMALSLPLYPVIYFTLTIVVLVGLIWRLGYALRYKLSLEVALIIFILAGALGNLVDRFLYGGVVDFIQISLGSVFNLADVAIVVAVGIWIGSMIYHDKHKKVSATS